MRESLLIPIDKKKNIYRLLFQLKRFKKNNPIFNLRIRILHSIIVKNNEWKINESKVLINGGNTVNPLLP